MKNYKTDGYYTHQPVLMEVIKNTKGDILECGCGEGSTKLIKELIKNTNRKLVSLESNLYWLNKYKNLADASHELHYIDAGNVDNIETGNKWVEIIKQKNFNDFEIVFIDSSPWLSRKCLFDYFLNKAKIIIFHDFDYFSNNNIIGKAVQKEIKSYNNVSHETINIDGMLDGIVKNYRLIYPPHEYFVGTTGHPTLVCSNTMSGKDFVTLLHAIEYDYDLYYTYTITG